MKRFAWWNQYGARTPEEVTARAINARLDCVINKAGFTRQRESLIAYNVPFATEIYAYPNRIDDQVQLLKADIDAGALFVVINAEVEWQTLDSAPMIELVSKVMALGKPFYACTDTRGDRMTKPYQRVLADACHGWMPMIYPGAFQQTTARAFAAALDGHMSTAPLATNSFRGKPVIPAIQAYDNIGPASVALQIAECERRQLAGFGVYTIAHATDAEWDAVAASEPNVEDNRPDVGQLNKAGDIFASCAVRALRGERLPDELHAAAKYLIS